MHGFLFQKIKTDNAFQNNIDESNRKPSKIWVNKASEFYNRSVKSWLKGNDIEMYSIHDKGESNLSKLSNVVKNDVAEKTELVKKSN